MGYSNLSRKSQSQFSLLTLKTINLGTQWRFQDTKPGYSMTTHQIDTTRRVNEQDGKGEGAQLIMKFPESFPKVLFF